MDENRHHTANRYMRKRDLKGKRYFPKKERKAKIVEYENSGLTQWAFAEKEVIKYATFMSQLMFDRRKYQPSVKQTFTEFTLPENIGYIFELILTSCVVVRASDAAEVASLFNMLNPC